MFQWMILQAQSSLLTWIPKRWATHVLLLIHHANILLHWFHLLSHISHHLHSSNLLSPPSHQLHSSHLLITISYCLHSSHLHPPPAHPIHFLSFASTFFLFLYHLLTPPSYHFYSFHPLPPFSYHLRSSQLLPSPLHNHYLFLLLTPPLHDCHPFYLLHFLLLPFTHSLCFHLALLSSSPRWAFSASLWVRWCAVRRRRGNWGGKSWRELIHENWEQERLW